MRPQAELIRFVLDPDNRVVPDLAQKLPGRGLWVSADAVILGKAVRTNAFAKVTRCRASVSPELADQVGLLLLKRCQRWLGQAKGAGVLQLGYFQVREALLQGAVSVLIQSSDAAENGKAKLASLAGEMVVVTCFSRTELGAAVGRAAAVHMALTSGKITTRLLREAHRFAGTTNRGHIGAGEQRKAGYGGQDDQVRGKQ